MALGDETREIGLNVGMTDSGADEVVKDIKEIGSAAEDAGKKVEKLEKDLQKTSKSKGTSTGTGSTRTSTSVTGQEAVDIEKTNQAFKAQSQYIRDAAAAGAEYGENIYAANARSQSSIANTRYALYDLASTYRTVGLTAGAAVAAIVGVSASFESAFTGVERTVDAPVDKINALRDALVDMSTEIPVAFTDLSEVATIGGQLDISASAIETFTENVVQFSATTNASIDAAATGFGRIAQLTDTSQDQFENIGSAVYQVGVKSVATETEILNMSQAIAASANLANYSAAEVIGLSGALSSLGVQPEQARTVIQTVFNDINKAISSGGTELDNFAAISGMTASEFKTAWGSDAANTFNRMLSGMASSGTNLTNVLTTLGFTNAREVNTLTRLSQNMDVVNQTMQESRTSYADATALSDAYGMVADNVASKLVTLKNSILGIFDAMGQNSGAGAFLDVVQDITEGVRSIVTFVGNIPVLGDAFGAITTGGIAAVAVVGLVKAGVYTLKASYLALLTAGESLNAGTVRATTAFWGLSRAFAGAKVSAQGAGATMTSLSLASRASAVASGLATTAWTAFTRAFLPLAATTAAVWAIGKAIDAVTNSTKSASEKASDMGISWAGLGDAIQQDTATWKETGEALHTWTVEGDTAKNTSSGLASAMGLVQDSANGTAAATDTATTAQKNYTLAMGAETQRVIMEQIAGSEKLQDVYSNYGSVLESVGFSWQTYLQKIMSQDGTADAYLAGFLGKVDVAKGKLYDKVDEMNYALQGVGSTFPEQGLVIGDEVFSSWDQFKEEIGSTYDSIDGLDAAKGAFGDLRDVSADLTDQISGTTAEAGLLGDMGYQTADGLDTATSSAVNLSDTLWGSMSATSDFEQAMYNLGGSIAENGYVLDAYSEAGRANMSSMSQVVNAAATAAGGDMNVLAKLLAQALAALGGTGTQAGQLFATKAQSIINDMAAGTNKAIPQVANLAAGLTNESFAAGLAAKKTDLATNANKRNGSSAASAAKEVYTLTDYINDLSGVMSRAFELRWGLDQATDDVANAYQNLLDMRQDAVDAVSDATDGLADARQKVKDVRLELSNLRAELNTLKANKNTLEYQLTVATDYGDTLRAQEIMAELGEVQQDIAENQNDQSKSSKELSKAQSSVTTASRELAAAQAAAKQDLSGNTENSRDQRKAVLDLVQSYQDQVLALSDSGRSQAEVAAETERLRQKFIEQMKQLGYSTTEAKKYAATFGDIKKAVESIPKKLTITVGSPVDTALREWRAKNTNGRGLSQGVNIPISSTFNDSGSRKAAKAAQIAANIAKWQQEYAAAMSSNNAMRIRGANYTLQAIQQWTNKLLSGNYWSGGFTGSGGKYDAAGVVHKGEYVFRKDQVDQSTGLPYASVLGSMLAGSLAPSAAPRATSTPFPSVLQVELSPTDRNLLRQGGSVAIMVDGKVLATTVNNQNTNTTSRGS